MLKQLKDIKYPKDFKCPKMSVMSEARINKLIQQSPEHEFLATGNILVSLASTGHVEVYIMIAECEVEVPW